MKSLLPSNEPSLKRKSFSRSILSRLKGLMETGTLLIQSYSQRTTPIWIRRLKQLVKESCSSFRRLTSPTCMGPAIMLHAMVISFLYVMFEMMWNMFGPDAMNIKKDEMIIMMLNWKVNIPYNFFCGLGATVFLMINIMHLSISAVYVKRQNFYMQLLSSALKIIF